MAICKPLIVTPALVRDELTDIQANIEILGNGQIDDIEGAHGAIFGGLYMLLRIGALDEAEVDDLVERLNAARDKVQTPPDKDALLGELQTAVEELARQEGHMPRARCFGEARGLLRGLLLGGWLDASDEAIWHDRIATADTQSRMRINGQPA